MTTESERIRWLEAGLAEAAPETAVEALATSPGAELIGFHASSSEAIVSALREAAVSERDVFVDLGSGDGKAVFLARILTGASARGVELQRALVERSRRTATRLAIDVSFVHGDARTVAIDDGTVFFMYVPFTGAALAAVAARLHAVAVSHPIVVCALGVDLARVAPWLRRRSVDSFWLEVYDGG